MTGRGNFRADQIEKLKDCLMAHPEGITGIELANAIGVTHARAMRLLDAADQNGFLTCLDGTGKNTRFYALENVS
jgi:uncharacterized protein